MNTKAELWEQLRLMLNELLGHYLTAKQVLSFIKRHFKTKEAEK
jgi:hypothetical protein